MELVSTEGGQELQLLQERKPCLWLPVKSSGHRQQVINLCHRVWDRYNTSMSGFKSQQDGARMRLVSDFQFPVFVTKHDIFHGISLTRVNSWGTLLTS